MLQSFFSRTPDPNPSLSPSSQRSHFSCENILSWGNRNAFHTLSCIHGNYARPSAAYPPSRVEQIKSFDHFETDWSHWAALDSFLGTHGRSAKVIYLFIGTRKWCTPIVWNNHDTMPHIMRYPNIRTVAKQSTLVSPLRWSGYNCPHFLR